MNTPYYTNAIEKIQTKEQLVNFLRILKEDYSQNEALWENTTIDSYIDSIRMWIEEGDILDWENLKIADIARLFYIGKIYR